MKPGRPLVVGQRDAVQVYWRCRWQEFPRSGTQPYEKYGEKHRAGERSAKAGAFGVGVGIVEKGGQGSRAVLYTFPSRPLPEDPRKPPYPSRGESRPLRGYPLRGSMSAGPSRNPPRGIFAECYSLTV